MHGALICPGDAEYHSARKVWNGRSDKYPAAIVRCIDAANVIASITFAREQGIAVAVRSGGHSMAGHGTTDGGMMIDLSPTKAISIDHESGVEQQRQVWSQEHPVIPRPEL